ncbi:ABC transporter permease [Lutibacter sp. B2]|nr:ABC transporter permease [Lutibacter sp. B2]
MNYLLRRGCTLIITLLFVSMITFVLFQLIPGDPALAILGLDAEEGQIQELHAQLGLELPMHMRYIHWMSNVLKGDFGASIRFSRPVVDLIYSRLPVTLSLAIMSIGIAIIVAIPLGILAVRSHNKGSDYLISIITQLGMAIPSFWLGIIFILIFGLKLGWFIPGRYIPWNESMIGAFKSLLFPSLAMSIPVIAVIIRYLRTSLLEQMKLDYVRTAYSKGFSKKLVVYRHVLKNALIPVITVIGMMVASVLGGSLVIEQVFALPGLGRLLVASIKYRDIFLIQGIVMYIASVVIGINFIIDILYKSLDPRIQIK